MPQSTVRICAIAGGSGSGKTTLALALLDRLGEEAAHHTIDWYYRDLSHLTPQQRAEVNFDHPDALEVDLFVDHLQRLRSGNAIEAPVYDFATHTRTEETRAVPARPIFVVEGIHLLALAAVRDLVDLRVFIDIDADVRLARRLKRDVAERGRTPQSVRAQWAATVAPMHDRFVQPSAPHADRTVTLGEDLDMVAAELARCLTS